MNSPSNAPWASDPVRTPNPLTRAIDRLRWEWKLAVADRSFKTTLLLLALLTGLASFAGHSWAQGKRSVIDAIRAKSAEEEALMLMAYSGEQDPEKVLGRAMTPIEKGRAETLRMVGDLPGSLAYFGAAEDAMAPPSSLAGLSVGGSDLRPDRYKITAWSTRTIMDREDLVNPSFLATAPFDPSAFVAVLMPLILIALTYDLISGDRERGVLALILSQPTSYGSILAARLACKILIPAALVIVGTAAGLAAGGVDLPAPAVLSRFVLWSSLTLSYAAFWGALALAVNVAGGSSIANAIALVVAWGTLVVAVPSAVARAAEAASPVPSQAELVTREREAEAEAVKDGNAILDRYYSQHPEIVRPSKKEDPYGQNRWVAIGEAVDRRMRPEFDRRREGLEGRLDHANRWIPASPALAVKSAMDDLAGVGFRHHIDFLRATEDFHTRYMDYMRPLMMRRGKMSRDEFDLIPSYGHLSLTDEVHHDILARGLAIPAAWAVSLTLAAMLGLRNPIKIR